MVDIVTFEQKDLEQTVSCLTRTFAQESMSQVLGINANSYILFAKMICQKAIYERLSLVAKDEKSGNVVGFSILEDFITKDYNPYYVAPHYVDPRFYPIQNLIFKLYGGWYEKNYPIRLGEILHILMVGVDKKYQGKAHFKLMKETLNVAKNNHYKSLIAEATTFIIQQILAKRYGFKVLKEIEYKSYYYNGKPVFKDIEKTSHCQLMMKTYEN